MYPEQNYRICGRIGKQDRRTEHEDDETGVDSQGQCRRVLLKLALPVMLANAMQTIYGVVTCSGSAGWPTANTAMAAVNFVGPMIHAAMAFGIGMSIAGTSLIPSSLAWPKREARRTAGQLIAFSFFFSCCWPWQVGFGPATAGAFGAEGLILEHGWTYLSVILGRPSHVCVFAFQSIKQGQGDTFTPMLLASASVVLNMVLDPLLMFTFGMG